MLDLMIIVLRLLAEKVAHVHTIMSEVSTTNFTMEIFPSPSKHLRNRSRFAVSLKIENNSMYVGESRPDEYNLGATRYTRIEICIIFIALKCCVCL